jgi:glycosyltransferase involved in cell wall biosynthesis
VRTSQWGIGKLRTVSFVLSAVVSLLRGRRQFDIVHAHLAFAPAVIAAVSARLLGKRCVVKYGNSGRFGDVQSSLGSWRGRLRMLLLRHWAHAHVALDDQIERELVGAGFLEERIHRIVNGIDARRFIESTDRKAAKEALGLQGRTVILFVGRLSEQKALPFLIEAFSAAIGLLPELQLVLVGQGPLESKLRDQARHSGAADRISFIGHVRDVRPFLNAADVFVMPSLAEGISNALLEAMATGLPCVASDVGGSAELLDHGACGVLVPPGDAKRLSRAIVRLAGDQGYAKRLGSAARSRIRTQYDMSVVAGAYLKLYEQLLGVRLSSGGGNAGAGWA